MSHPASSTAAGRMDPSGAVGPVARTFQHYELLRHEDGSPWELGRGTMGITYKAFDVNLCCEVALKVINSALLDHPRTRERFVREARAAAALRHRNVASVYHLGNDGERFFYAMELIDGETLDALVRREGPLPVRTALRLMLQAARALAAAARQNLVHRDIKPANIMVVREDADDHLVVKIIDFGLARPVTGGAGGTSTGQLTGGGFVGTPQFASPEQLEEQRLDARSDIYSLGVTTWFLLTGRVPFTGSLATVCQAHLTKTPPWEQLPDWLPAPVRGLLAHMLEKHPADRPQDAVELRREIEECLEAVAALARLETGPPAPAQVPRPASAEESPPAAGTVLLDRYELVRAVREGRRGRVFEARDRCDDGQRVTLTFLPAELLAGAECDRLADEVRLVQAAAHPHLTQVVAFERPAGGTGGFLVEEWINGGTLVELLAAREGILPVAEGLRLLGQAAAAVDHAISRRLERLDLAIHQIRLHFGPPAADKHAAHDPRDHLFAAMTAWPTWALKINPLGAIRESTELGTWAGEVTLVPGIDPAPDTSANAYLHALVVLINELLGAPGAVPGKHVSLPALNEGANAVLRQACGSRPGFRSGRVFYEALARAAGFDPISLQIADTATPPVARQESAGLPPPRDLSVPATRSGRHDAEGERTAAPAFHRTGRTASRTGSVAVFLSGSETGFDVPDGDFVTDGSISGRLTLVDGDPAPIGRWLFGTLALAAVFLLVVGGVWFGLVQGLPGRRPMSNALRETFPTPKGQSQKAAVTPRPTIPPPLPAEPVHKPASPTPATARRAAVATTPLPTPPAPTPSPTVAAVPEPTPVTDAPVPAKLVAVYLKSIPSGAVIRSDGTVLGTTPCEVELSPGIHQLIARFNGWPETRETITLGDDQPRATAEIHLMPPGLVPSAGVPPPSVETGHPRREATMATRPPLLRPSSGGERRAVPEIGEASPGPEVRRALPPLTPFDPDPTPGPREATPGGD